MTRILLVGGGTAGHINPMLAVANEAVRQGDSRPEEILVVGSKNGMEEILVPQAGIALRTVPRLPLPRRLSLAAFMFIPRVLLAVLRSIWILKSHKPDVVTGFGGYVAAPVYVAAWIARVPLVIHEANATAGFANRLGASFTNYVATTFSLTNLRKARLIGMPIRRSLSHPEVKPNKITARNHFGLSRRKKTLLVIGGSQGAARINSTLEDVVPVLTESGWQVLHIVGPKNQLPKFENSSYVALGYCDRMDLAFAAATAVISRAGSASVAEIALLGVPAIFVPYPVGNGEQEKNALDLCRAGAAVLVGDAQFTPEYFYSSVMPLLGDSEALRKMRRQFRGLARIDAAFDLLCMIREARGGEKK